MPVNQKKMDALQKEYGAKKGKDIYYALENKAKSAAGIAKSRKKSK